MDIQNSRGGQGPPSHPSYPGAAYVGGRENVNNLDIQNFKTVRKFDIKWQPKIGSWSKKGQNLANVVFDLEN